MASIKKNRDKKRLKIEEKKRQNLKSKNEINPFEIHHNRIKHKVLGRKIAKNEFGKPLINRNRAFKKREQTLLEEYKNKHKSGKGLQDLREKDDEKRMMNKYKQEQNQIHLDKNDVIKLTHKGKPLEDLIDDRISDDDDEALDLFNRDNYVETAHFGGGQEGPPRSKNDILDEIIAEKMKIKLDREETVSLTNKLDNQWNEIKNLIRHKGSNQPVSTAGHDEYDSLLRQLIFDDQDRVKENKTLTMESKIQANDQTFLQTPDALFKSKLKSIDSSNDILQIIKTIQEIIGLLPKISQKSIAILKERLINMTKANLKFTPKEMTILAITAYFKEFSVLIYLVVLKTLNKIKYSSLNEIACSIFLMNFLLRSISKEKFYPELFTHLDNLVGLCLPQEKIRLKLFHRLEYDADCILNIKNFGAKLKENPKYTVTLTNLFCEKFKTNDKILAFNLSIQVFKLLSNFYEKYSSFSAILFMLSSIIQKISYLNNEVINDSLKNSLNDLMAKFGKTESKSVIINTIQTRPFILPLLEPKFEEDSGRIRPKASEHKKLVKKYKREFKGAQREIRKDSKFLRETYLKEMEKKDRIRNKKVKEILRDLSIQQGLYKKTK